MSQLLDAQPTDSAPAFSENSPTVIQIQGLNKWYGEYHALRDINLEVRQGERIVLCGPSGSGKSTLIRCINQLEAAEKGSIVIDNVNVMQQNAQSVQTLRNVGMVFQHFNLFPHMSVL